MRPLIGVTSYFVNDYEFSGSRIRGMYDQDMLMSTMDYSNALVNAGGIPLVIAPIDDDCYLEAVVEQMDGLLLAGGGDVNPKLYSQPFKKGLGKLETRRDKVEMKLIELAVKNNVPIFGICRGFQLIKVYFGGTLIQDIGNYLDTEIEHVGTSGLKSTLVHQVVIDEDSFLKGCFNEKVIFVNSYHHQAIDQLAHGLKPTGVSEDEIIEAFVHREKENIYAVQWHPEMMCDVYKEQLELFRLFIRYSEVFKKTKLESI